MITYCTNIYPAESWHETFSHLLANLDHIKEAVLPQQCFAIGLRLSCQAAMEIDERGRDLFLDWCRQHDCCVPTINGFSFGAFHAGAIKEKVYLPDWRDRRRADYSNRLADLLDRWLPTGMAGSISSVPVGFHSQVRRADYGVVRQNLLASLTHLERLFQKSGKKIILAMEPEPCCVLETVNDFLVFRDEMKLPANLAAHLGICLDCCHLAVKFATPQQSLSQLTQADVPIGKVQISSALCAHEIRQETLLPFCDPCYLHQVVVKKSDNSCVRYDDLPQALSRHLSEGTEEWRIHFRLPIFVERTQHFVTTRSFIDEMLPLLPPDTLLEVETYTWHVLPPELHTASVTDSVIRELQWLKGKLDIGGRKK